MKKGIVLLLSLMLVLFAALPGTSLTNYKPFALGLSPDPFALGFNAQYWMSENYGIQADYLNTTLATIFLAALVNIVSPGTDTNSSLTEIGLNYRPSLGFVQTIYNLSVAQVQFVNTTQSFVAAGAALKIGDDAVSLQLGLQGLFGNGAMGALPYLSLYYNF